MKSSRIFRALIISALAASFSISTHASGDHPFVSLNSESWSVITSPLTLAAIAAVGVCALVINYPQAPAWTWEDTVRIEQEDWDNCVFMTGSTRGCPGQDHRQIQIEQDRYWGCVNNCLSQCKVEKLPTFDQCLDVGPVSNIRFTSKGEYKEIYRQCFNRCR